MAGGESKGLRRYDKESLLWQSTVAIKSDPVGSEISHGVAAEVVAFLGKKAEAFIADIIAKVFVGKKLLSIPFEDEINALADSEYLPYLIGSPIEYNGRYYLRHTTHRTYENSLYVPPEEHLKVPMCSRLGEVETIGTKIGDPFWTSVK